MVLTHALYNANNVEHRNLRKFTDEAFILRILPVHTCLRAIAHVYYNPLTASCLNCETRWVVIDVSTMSPRHTHLIIYIIYITYMSKNGWLRCGRLIRSCLVNVIVLLFINLKIYIEKCDTFFMNSVAFTHVYFNRIILQHISKDSQHVWNPKVAVRSWTRNISFRYRIKSEIWSVNCGCDCIASAACLLPAFDYLQ